MFALITAAFHNLLHLP